MFSHFISHSPTVSHKGNKVLMVDHPYSLRRPCTPLWSCMVMAGPVTGMDYRAQLNQSKVWLSTNPDVSNRNLKKTELSLSLQRHGGLLSRPPGLCDPTKRHSHSSSAERILSSWLTVKWYPMRCGYGHRISYEVGKSLYQQCSPPCCSQG